MRTPKKQDSDNVMTRTTEVRMKHYDKGDAYNERVTQQQNLVAKEASCIQAVGYTPTSSLPASDWDAMVGRDNLRKTSDGKYKATDVYQGEIYNARYE